MKTLYVSDLDGTLLRSDETTSEYTNSVINNLTDRGMIDGAFACYGEEGDKWTAGRNSVDRVQWCVYRRQCYR